LVERRSRKAQASGSIPLAGSRKFKDLWLFAVSPFFIAVPEQADVEGTLGVYE
jgi:hypothetical protein